jgi:hypothetical protein
MQPFNTFLIDPFKREVTEVHFAGDYKQIYPLIDCDCFDIARINEHGDGICVDDEGLYREEQAFFYFTDYPQPLAGKGLVLGCRASDGETIAPTITLEQLKAKVKFVMPLRINGEFTWIDEAGHRVEVEA